MPYAAASTDDANGTPGTGPPRAPSTATPAYKGRFAPSPTGPLHFGSLVAAVGSYVDARAQGGKWALRIEDLDPPRELPGAADAILKTLDSFGFEWDGEVAYQSRRQPAYAEAVTSLLSEGWAYPCACSRKEVASAGVIGAEGPIYPGTCRARTARETLERGVSIRVISAGAMTGLHDRVRGLFHQNIGYEVGDYVVRRADRLFAYHLAVVLDDAWQGITHVVRGADLLFSTPRQIHLQRLLGVYTPAYAHLPLAVDRLGRKLSKQDRDRPVDAGSPLPSLLAAWSLLGQTSPPDAPGTPGAFWDWAVQAWDIAKVPRRHAIRTKGY